MVLLDAGGVLFDNMTEQSPFIGILAERFGVDAELLTQRYGAQDQWFETGAISGAAAVASALRSLGVPPAAICQRAVRDLYGALVRPNVELMEYLRWRRRRAVRPPYHLTLANNEAPDWDAEKNRLFGHLQLCDSLSSSWQLGVAKPDPTFFLHGLARLRMRPADAVLVDDNVACLRAARAVGLRTHEFTAAEDVIAMLERL